MRNILKFLIIFAIIVIICAPCVQGNTVPFPKDPHDCDAGSCALPLSVSETRTLFAQENWQFSAPANDWEIGVPTLPEIKIVSGNKSRNCLFSFVKEETNAVYGKYVIENIEAFTQDGNTITSAKQVVINKNKFIRAEIHNNTTIAWLWITVINGFGYGLFCGGDIVPDAGTSLSELCQDIANSIEIK